jgi:hypothetical protein
MAARTITARARNTAREMEFLAHGQDLVQTSSHWPTCPKCAPWNGVIVSLTGTDENYPSMETARNEGLFHANCLHSFSIYIPGFSDEGRTEVIPDEEAQRKNEEARKAGESLKEQQLDEERVKRRERYQEKSVQRQREAIDLNIPMQLRGAGYSPGYKEKLLELDKTLRENGMTASEHALNKLQGRLNSSKKGYHIVDVGEVVDAFKNGERYVDLEQGYVIVKNKIAIHQTENGIVKTVTVIKKVKDTWKKQ